MQSALLLRAVNSGAVAALAIQLSSATTVGWPASGDQTRSGFGQMHRMAAYSDAM